MQAGPSFSISKVSALALFGIAIATALVTQPTCASLIDSANANEIVLTETSPTSLTATYTLADGSTEPVTIDFLLNDTWHIFFPASVEFTIDFVQWAEPESTITVNQLIPFTSDIIIFSDFSSSLSGSVPNGTTVGNVATDFSNGLPANATFFDNAATAEGAAVPDGGYTFCLLFLSLVGLSGATALRFA
jgi:hypothetical protein